MKTSIDYSPRAPKLYHHPSKDRLFVRKVTGLDVLNQASTGGTVINDKEEKVVAPNDVYYAKCPMTGKVDWTETEIYDPHDLVARDNVHVIN